MAKDVKDIGSTIRFLSYIANKVSVLTTAIDSQVNILVGVSSAIFVFATSRAAGTDTSFVSFSLSLFSGLSAIMALLAIHPPRFLRGRRGRDGIMNIYAIEKHKSAGAYAEHLREIVDSQDQVIDQFSFEIYNRTKFYYRPKRSLYRWARNILLLGIGMSLAGYLLDIFLRTPQS